MARSNLREIIDKPLRHAKATLKDIFSPSGNGAERTRSLRVLAGVLFTVLEKDKHVSSADLDIMRSQWGRHFPGSSLNDFAGMVAAAAPVAVADALPTLRKFDPAERQRFIGALLVLADSVQNLDAKLDFIRELGAGLEVSPDELVVIEEESRVKADHRKRLLKSGAGIIVSLIVLLVFILAATWLKSVIFGLLLAYLMLPVEQYFERKLKQKKGLLVSLFGSFSDIAKPFEKASRAIRGHDSSPISRNEEVFHARKLLVTRATSLAFLVLLVFGILVGALLFRAGMSSFRSLRTRVDNWTQTAEPDPAVEQSSDGAPASDWDGFFDRVQGSLNEYKKNFEDIPVVKKIIEEIAASLNDRSAQQELIGMVTRRTGGVMSFTFGIIGAIGTFVLNILLTVFFFLLFLSKVAQFKLDHAEDPNQGGGAPGYIVRTVFNGSWLPGATEESVAEAERILGEVLSKLKTFVRGYLSLMLLDFTVYSTVFYFLGVPYFLILGAVAGCGILLPFLGPAASCVLTVLVTLALGGDGVSALRVLGIVGIYLLHNGVVEQFILYPKVIGNSLGLSALETIIVVLLGGFIAGITGMILAIPAAAVLKYLIPQIYRCWR